MTKTQKTLAVTGIVTTIALAAAYLKYRHLSDMVVEQFPELDEDIVREAYRNMLIKSVTGQYEDDCFENDATVTALFLLEVEALTETPAE